MPDEEKKAKLTLDLGTTPQGVKFLDDLKGTLSKSAAFAKELNRELAAASSSARRSQTYAPGMQPPGFAAAGGAGSPLANVPGAHVNIPPGTPGYGSAFATALRGQWAGMLSPQSVARFASIAGPAALAYGAVGSIQSAANYSHDPYMTSGQAGRALFRDVVPFGGRIQSFADSLSGRKFGMEQADVAAQIQGLRFGGQQQLASYFAGYNPQRAGLIERQRQLERGSAITLGPMERATATGEREFREASRLLPVRRELARLERDSAAASSERSASEQEVVKATARERDLIRQRQALGAKIMEDEGSGPDRQRMLTQFRETSEAASAAAQARRDSEEKLAAARQKETEARGAAARQRAEVKEAQAANMEERAQTAAGTARTLGGMNVFDRDFAVASVKAAQQFGFEALHPEMQAAARTIAPQTIGKMEEAAGAAYAERVGLGGIAPADFGGQPEELRRRAQEKRDEAERERYGAETDIAQGAVRAGERLGDAVNRAIAVTVDEAIKRIYAGKLIERNAP